MMSAVCRSGRRQPVIDWRWRAARRRRRRRLAVGRPRQQLGRLQRRRPANQDRHGPSVDLGGRAARRLKGASLTAADSEGEDGD